MYQYKENNLTKDVLKLNYKVIKKNKWIILGNFIVWLMIDCLPLLISVIISNLINSINNFDNSFYYLFCITLLLLSIGQSLIILLGGTVDTVTKFDIRQSVRKNLILNVLHMKNLKYYSGEILEILTSDILSIEELISVEIDFVCKVIFALVSIFLLIKVSVKITILGIILSLIIAFINSKIGNKVKERHYNARNQSMEFSKFINDVIIGREVIQLLGCENDITKRLDNILNERKIYSLKQTILVKLLGELTDLGGVLSVIFVLLLSIYEIYLGNFTVGDLTLAISLIAYVNEYNSLFTEVVCAFKYTDNTLLRIKKIFQKNVECLTEEMIVPRLNGKMKDELIPSPKQIEVKVKLRNKLVEFVMKPNELVVLCGKTGSGKSYLLRALMGEVEYEGEILYGGNDTRSFDFMEHIGVALQEPKFLDETIEENLNLKQKENDVLSVLKAVNLNEELFEFLKEKQTIGINGKKLSEGQRQRLAIARALSNYKDVLLLDDCTSLLDYRNEAMIINMLKKLKAFIIVATNRKNVIKSADKIIFIEEDKVISTKSIEELYEKNEEFRKMWDCYDYSN